MKSYKILDKTTGLYSGGGCSPKWTKHGKTWPTIGQVNKSLELYHTQLSGNKVQIPDSWVIVEFEVVAKKEYPAKDAVK